MLVLFRMCVSARKYLHVVRIYVFHVARTLVLSARGPYVRVLTGVVRNAFCTWSVLWHCLHVVCMYVSARGPYLRFHVVRTLVLSARGLYVRVARGP